MTLNWTERLASVKSRNQIWTSHCCNAIRRLKQRLEFGQALRHDGELGRSDIEPSYTAACDLKKDVAQMR